MNPRIHVEPGNEKWLKWARARLAGLSALRASLGLPKLVKALAPSPGVLVWLMASRFGDWIRIIGGALVAADPFQPLWNIQSAIMPGTRPGVTPVLAWSPSVQHITSFYPSSDGSHVRKHWLVICRYGKRVAEHQWDEEKVMETPGTPAVPGPSFSVSVQGGVLSIQGSDLVIASPNGIAGSTLWQLSGTALISLDLNSLGVPFVFTPDGTSYTLTGSDPGTGTPAVPATFATTKAYVTHASDGSSVTLRDTASDGTFVDTVVPISPTLVELSTDNPWGWIDAGPSALHPGAEPNMTSPSLGTSLVQTVFPGAPCLAPSAISDITVTLTVTDAAGVVTATPIGTGATVFFNTNCVDRPNVAMSDSTTGVVGFASGGTLMSAGSPLVATSWSGTEPPVSVQVIATGLDPEEMYLIGSSSQSFHIIEVPWGGPAGSVQIINTFVAGPAGTKAIMDAKQALHDAWRQRCLDCAIEIVDTSASAIDEKKFGDGADLAELRPYDSAADHRLISAAIVIPAYSAAQYTFTLASAPSFTATYDYRSGVLHTLFPASIYGVTLGVSSPAVPPPPDTPWAVEVEPLRTHRYVPADKTFAAAEVDVPPLRNAGYSKGVVPPLLLGQTASLGYNGFYRAGGKPAADLSKATFADLSEGALSSLMQRLCVGAVTRAELAYIVFHSIGQATQALAYRQAPHTQVSGAFTFEQPPIEPPA